MKMIEDFLNSDSRNLNDLSELCELSAGYKKSKDYKNYFKTNLLIVEILNENERYNDSIEICNMLFEITPDNEIEEQYKALLDQFVYIYITKQYYQRALFYCMEKKKYIDNNNKDEVNRWYLELAYIYEATGQKNEALMKMESILYNKPDITTKIFCLSGITKLYVDANSLVEAKIYLKKCIDAVKENNDFEGQQYCDYLQARIYRQEKLNKEANKIFTNMFKTINKIDFENLNYLNEYLNLLVDIKDYTYAYRLCEKFFNDVNNSIDLQNKLLFYKNCLKIDLFLNNKKKKNFIIDSQLLLDLIAKLEVEIAANKDFIISEIKEEELSVEAKNAESELIQKITEILLQNNFDTNDGNIRTYLNKFCKIITDKNPLADINLVIFNKSDNMLLPGLLDGIKDSNFLSLTYKNNRIYERKFKFEDLSNTIIEEIMTTNSLTQLNLTKSDYGHIDYITKKTYKELNYNYVLAIPLFNSDVLYGAIIFQSQTNNILIPNTLLSLKIHTKLLEVNLLNLFFNESSKLQLGIIESATKQLEVGIFYNIIESKTICLSNDLKKLLNFRKNAISEKQLIDLIVSNDLEAYMQKYDYIEKGKSYKIDYHIKLNDKIVLVHEQASKYLAPNEEIYYCGTISIACINDAVIDEVNSKNVLSEEVLKKDLDSLRKKNFNCFVIKCQYLNSLDIHLREEEIKQIFNVLKTKFSEKIYLLDCYFVILKENLKAKEIDTIIEDTLKDIKSNTYTVINYPDVLVRLDDLINVIKYTLDKTSGKVIFNNDSYALFISKITISNCIINGIFDKTITINYEKFSINNTHHSMKIIPSVNGVYNNDSLKVISQDLSIKLDEHVINMSLEDLEYDNYYYSLSSYSLLNILKKFSLSEKKYIFELTDSKNTTYINELVLLLSKTKHKLIICSEHLQNLNLLNLQNNSSVILGFNEKLDENLLEIFKTFSNKFYLFN